MNDKIEHSLHKICPPWAQTDPNWIPNSKANSFFDELYSFIEFNIVLESKKK